MNGHVVLLAELDGARVHHPYPQRGQLMVGMLGKKLLEPILDPQASVRSRKEKSMGIVSQEQFEEESGAQDHPITPPDETTATPGSEESDGERTPRGKSNINEEFVVVRILEDLPTFKAMDNRNYTLRAEDVVVLPALNAKGLIKRNAAQIIPDN